MAFVCGINNTKYFNSILCIHPAAVAHTSGDWGLDDMTSSVKFNNQSTSNVLEISIVTLETGWVSVRSASADGEVCVGCGAHFYSTSTVSYKAVAYKRKKTCNWVDLGNLYLVIRY